LIFIKETACVSFWGTDWMFRWASGLDPAPLLPLLNFSSFYLLHFRTPCLLFNLPSAKDERALLGDLHSRKFISVSPVKCSVSHCSLPTLSSLLFVRASKDKQTNCSNNFNQEAGSTAFTLSYNFVWSPEWHSDSSYWSVIGWKMYTKVARLKRINFNLISLLCQADSGKQTYSVVSLVLWAAQHSTAQHSTDASRDLLSFKCFNLYTETSMKYKLIILLPINPFMCIICMSRDSYFLYPPCRTLNKEFRPVAMLVT
jgi:hypothetical protein